MSIDPYPPEITNSDRAAWAAEAIDAYRDPGPDATALDHVKAADAVLDRFAALTGTTGEDIGVRAGDFLADCAHLCDEQPGPALRDHVYRVLRLGRLDADGPAPVPYALLRGLLLLAELEATRFDHLYATCVGHYREEVADERYATENDDDPDFHTAAVRLTWTVTAQHAARVPAGLVTTGGAVDPGKVHAWVDENQGLWTETGQTTRGDICDVETPAIIAAVPLTIAAVPLTTED